MSPRFVFLLIMRAAAGLRLSRREEAWKTAEILMLLKPEKAQVKAGIQFLSGTGSELQAV
jgi:hypothetical protein